MKYETFPKLKPPAIDSPDLRPPTVVNIDDIEISQEFPKGEGKTKYLLTEENAGCKYANIGLFLAEPGQGSQWHTHPQQTEEEEYLYIIKGKGIMYYKQGGKDYEVQFKEGDAIFSGHLTHYLKNTGTETLSIYFSVAPLPATTIIYGTKNDKGLGYVDSVNLNPPRVVHPEDVKEVVFFPKGGARNRLMLFPEIVGGKHARFGTYLAEPGQGSHWHTHPWETGQEDLFYIVRGKGTMFYLQGGKEHSFEFKEGDAIHSHHLTNYTKNTSTEDLFIIFTDAPNTSKATQHELVV